MKKIRKGDFIKYNRRYYLVLRCTSKSSLGALNAKFKTKEFVSAIVLKKMAIRDTRYVLDWDIFDMRKAEILNDHPRKAEFIQALLKLSIK